MVSERERRRRRKGKDEARVPFLDRQVRGEGEREEEEEGRVVAEATLFHLVVFLRRSSLFPCSSVLLLLFLSFAQCLGFMLQCKCKCSTIQRHSSILYPSLFGLGPRINILWWVFFFNVSIISNCTPIIFKMIILSFIKIISRCPVLETSFLKFSK